MALTASQIAERLLKKVSGVADTRFPINLRQITEEATATYFSVSPNDIWTQGDQIPTTPPVLSHSASSGVVKYYDKLLLVQNDAGSSNSFRGPVGELADAISAKYGFGYNFKVWNNAGTQQITKGDFLVDPESGIITFYNMGDTLNESPSVTINNSSPPRITFYKYIGTKGFGSGSGVGTIIGVTAGTGLSGGGTQGAITLSVNLGVNSGLTFSGDDIILATTIPGDRTFSDSVTINGNLTVNGTVSNVYTQNLFVEDNIITLNGTYSGPYNALNAGIEANLGGGTYAALIWDNTTSLWSAGFSGSVSSIITGAGTGLTKSGNLLSIDYNKVTGVGLTQNGSSISVNFDNITGYGLTQSGGSMSINLNSITGAGLTQNGTQIFIDTAGFAGNLAGNGLSASGGTISVNVGNGLSIQSDTVYLGGTLSQNTKIGANTKDFAIEDFDILSLTGSMVDIQLNDGLFLVDTGDAGSIDLYGGDVLVYATGSVDIISTSEFTLDTASGSITTLNSKGLVYTSDYSASFVSYSLVSKSYVDAGTASLWQAISNINGDFVTGITAGQGLTGGGVDGFLTLDMNWGGTSSGTTFSGDAIGVVVDGTTIKINNSGQLAVVAGASSPVYDRFTMTLATSGNDSATGLTLSSTPNNYSRIQVFVNGQLQRLGNGTISLDCYFGTAPTTPIGFSNLSIGDQLYWNGIVAGYDLSTTDIVDIVYET